tara:strand:- start:177 stop:365 length:189 start_codon:yes stop_codon:yes gene_type:complete
MNEIKNKRVKIFLKNKFCYKGKVLDRDEKFIQLLDGLSGKSIMINLDDISTLEVQDNERFRN